MAVAAKKAVEARTLDASCSRSNLLRAVSMLRQISATKSVPITSNVLLRSVEDGLAVEATNLDVFGLVTIPGESRSAGAVTVDAKRLGEFVRELPDGDVSIVGQANDFVEVRSGKSRARMVGITADDFPVMVGADASEVRVVIDGDSLGDMIDRALFAVATDDVRPSLAGVKFEFRKDKFGLAGTDGHRLSHETVDAECSGEKDAVVPAAGLRVVRRALGSENVTVAISESVAWFSSADWMIGARLIEGDYPDYSQVIPTGPSTVLDVPREDLIASIRRVSVVTSDRARGIKLRLADGALHLLAQSADYGEATESVACEVVSGAKAEVGFNASYLLQAVEAVSGAESVRLAVGHDEKQPAVISVPELDGWLHVLMPLRM
jgi:DNA polymerase-3 subunit beta